MKKAILLLFWGIWPEHEISVRSARNILSWLDKTLYHPIIVWVDKQSRRRLCDSIPWDLVEVFPSWKEVTITDLSIDCVFSIIHWTWWEDWEIQRLAESLSIPIVGCWSVSSALCIDKIETKKCLEDRSIKTSPYLVSTKSNPLPWDEISQKLWTPVFFKTPSQWSSVGVYMVENENQYAKSLELCYWFDERVLIEQAIVWREIEFAVLWNELLTISPPWEIIQWDDWRYSYEDKYSNWSNAATKIVTNFPWFMVAWMKIIVENTYRALWCSWFARIDLFVTNEWVVYVNEVNTIPWFTSISMYPKLMEAAWIDITTLITRLIELALEKKSKQC